MMTTELGRNDKCWCGSGKKYKHCHMNRENQERPQVWNVTDALNKAFSMKICLAPSEWHGECKGGIVKSHTVPRSRSLDKISRDGHVYSKVRNLDVESFTRMDMFKPVLQGVRQASTFTGFCAKHDNDIFKPLEVKDFTGNPEQCFLVGYRAIARELYYKTCADQFVPFMKEMDKGLGKLDQIQMSNRIDEYMNRVQVGHRDILRYKKLYDSILNSQNFSTVRGYCIEFTNPPPVMCSGSIFPEYDFNGVKLHDLEDFSKIPDQISFSSFFGGKYGVIVFSWLADHERTGQKFIDSLKSIPNEFLFPVLLCFFFECCENIQINPDWWDGLTDGQRDFLTGKGIVLTDMTKGSLKNIRELNLHIISQSQLTVVERYEIPIRSG
ncbi:MAG: SEC-C domain-containing protein [Bacteroidetes bacterium]|nr:SEC-C domain-containing protein [Bacteroidota bacterium]